MLSSDDIKREYFIKNSNRDIKIMEKSLTNFSNGTLHEKQEDVQQEDVQQEYTINESVYDKEKAKILNTIITKYNKGLITDTQRIEELRKLGFIECTLKRNRTSIIMGENLSKLLYNFLKNNFSPKDLEEALTELETKLDCRYQRDYMKETELCKEIGCKYSDLDIAIRTQSCEENIELLTAVARKIKETTENFRLDDFNNTLKRIHDRANYTQDYIKDCYKVNTDEHFSIINKINNNTKDIETANKNIQLVLDFTRSVLAVSLIGLACIIFKLFFSS